MRQALFNAVGGLLITSPFGAVITAPSETEKRVAPKRATSASRQIPRAEKLARVVELSRELINNGVREKAALAEGRAEELFSYLLANFSGPVFPGEVHTLFASSDKDVDRLTTEFLDGIPDAFIPVVVARELLKKHRVWFHPRSVKSWITFSDRYADALFAH